jgi:tRNA G18 (ribose-2'-O)-methylase SpoU
MHEWQVEDPSDPRLSDYVALTDVELRRRIEPAAGLFIAEGEKVIRRALAAGYRMRSMLLEDKWLPALRDVLDVLDTPVYVATRALLADVTGYDVHRGALAAMDRKPLPTVAQVLADAHRVAVLEDVNDHTNIGAIFRSAAGLGMDAVLLTPRCADPLYRRSVKVSMGAVFSVPWTRLQSWPQDMDRLRDAGFSVLALTPDPQATSLDELSQAWRARPALVLGAEGSGLAQRTLKAADVVVRIPMAGGVDSLNVGAAAAVSFYALRHEWHGLLDDR